jgi:hypothetical protein
MASPTKDKNQSQRFIDKARELGCDEDPKAFERTFSKVVPPKKPQSQVKRQSDDIRHGEASFP